MSWRKPWVRDAIYSTAISTFVVFLVLWPYLENEKAGLDRHYRGVLIVTSVLAAPLIDRLPDSRFFIAEAALLTCVTNAAAIFVVFSFTRLAIRASTFLISKLKPRVC